MAATQYPGWSGAGGDTDRDWDTAILGGIILPGIVSVESLKVGIDVDTKKPKGSDQATSTDNGLEPAKFRIVVWLVTHEHWFELQAGLDSWNPRRPGRQRQPVELLHPLPNTFGIRNVRVLSVEASQPSAKSGMRVVIEVAEWFAAPKATVNKKVKPETARDYPALSEAIALGGGIAGIYGLRPERPFDTGEEMDPTTFQPLGPSSKSSIENNMFGDPSSTIFGGF
jgi:hypothetical protein